MAKNIFKKPRRRVDRIFCTVVHQIIHYMTISKRLDDGIKRGDIAQKQKSRAL